MTASPGMEGLRTEQAPPLIICASFYLLAPLAMFAAGAVLCAGGPGAAASRWLPLAMAATHLGTLGFLGAVMMGSLYQMIPVVAGAPVFAIRLAHVVHVAFATGVALLVAGLTKADGTLLTVAVATLLVSLGLFLVPVATALWRAPTRSETVTGMRLGTAGLLELATLGAVMALARAGRLQVRVDWVALVTAHATLGATVWVGGLLTAVSWQVVPMFYLTPAIPRWSQRATLGAVLFALVAVPSAVVMGGGALVVAAASAPAAAMVWLVHPFVTLRAIHRRKRRRVDGSVRLWWAGLSCAPLVPVLASGSLFGTDPRWSVALGWLAIWGWAGLIVHGMLTRIVPFLVWFHRFAPLAGRVAVPSMRGLLPDARIRLGLAVHIAAVMTGGASLLTTSSPLMRAAGALLCATAVVLFINLLHTFRQRPSREPLADATSSSCHCPPLSGGRA